MCVAARKDSIKVYSSYGVPLHIPASLLHLADPWVADATPVQLHGRSKVGNLDLSLPVSAMIT